LRELGITGVHDMGMGASTDALYREYAAAGKLTARIHGAYESVGASFDRLPDKGPAIRYGGDAYVLGSVKLFADGALGSRGAALRTPYTDKPDSTGLLFQQEAAIAGDMEKAMARGYQVAVHAIGDAANRQVLDAFEKLAAKYPVRTSRHRIEHAQVIALDDIERFAKLGVIASVQPTHATSDMNMAEARVGPERIRGAYAWRKLLASGARLACGSDFPVESANPFLGLHAAVTRESPGGVPAGGWYPAEKMTLAEALRCFTLDAAYAGRSEERQGSLEPGKWADFVVLDRDPFAVAPRELADLKVLETWLGGRRVR
jgi:predicted amidohydrolase YtcJ